jgi:hypothetical protein
MDILHKTFRRINYPSNSYATYWKQIRYTGIYFETFELLALAKAHKEELIELVLTYLPEEYTKLGKEFTTLLIYTTLYKGAFLLTPLEAYQFLNTHSDKFTDYKLLATYLSSVSIKERILRALTLLWEKYGLAKYSSIIDNSINYENYLARNILHSKLQEVCPFRLSERLEHGNYLHPRILAKELLRLKFQEYLTLNLSRNLILEMMITDVELFLKGVLPLSDINGKKHKLQYPCTTIEARLGKSLYTREVTMAYYEPLLFTRFTRKELSKEDTCLHFLDEADIYSKLVRISNLRSRPVFQDGRLLVMSAIQEGFKRISESYENPYL